MRPNRFTLKLAAILALGVVACEPPRKPSGGTAPPASPPTEPTEVYLQGLADMTAQALAALGTREEREARAPYSPENWPHERGDVVGFAARFFDLAEEFGDWQGVYAPFWLGKTVFGARFEPIDAVGAPDFEYIGHYPQKTSIRDGYWWSENLPEHLHTLSQTADGFTEIANSLFHPTARDHHGLDSLKLVWTEDAWLDGYTGEDGNQ